MDSIFISYAREDRDAALEIYQVLKEHSFRPWMDVKELLAGQDWELEIDRTIRNCNIFIACLSKNAVVKRGFIQSELKKALKVLETVSEGQVFLIPVRLDSCDVPSKLSHLHWIDYFTEDGPTELVRAISHHIATPSVRINEDEKSNFLSFANIAIDANNPNWKEHVGDADSPFDRQCSQYFRLGKFVKNADLSFDVTILNTASVPIIVTSVGIIISSVANITYVYGIPEAAKITKSDSYIVEVPDLRSELYSKGWRGSPLDLDRMIITKIPDPVYLEPKAPYRHGLLLKHYQEYMPNYAIIRLVAATNSGNSESKEIHLFTL